MTSLELKRMKVELLRVSAAKAQLELQIEECHDNISRVHENIKRLEDNILIQSAKEEELQAKIDSENQVSNN